MLAKLGAQPPQLIRAFELLIPRMSIGQIIELTAQPQYAYGVAGFPPVVPSNATLIYEIELIAFD